MTEDALPGTFGIIKPPKNNCKTTFKCLSSWRTSRYVYVDPNKGTLTLRRKPNSLPKQSSGIRKLVPPTKIKIRSWCRYRPFYVTVNLLVFPSKFGDRFLTKYNSMRMNKLVKEDTLELDAKQRSSQLHRMMRMVSNDRNPEAHEEMMESVKVKTVLEMAVNGILKKYIPKRQGNTDFLTSNATTQCLLYLVKERSKNCLKEIFHSV